MIARVGDNMNTPTPVRRSASHNSSSGLRSVLLGSIVILLGMAGGRAADLQLTGNFGYSTQNNQATVIITADRVENRTTGGTSGTIQLELWATSARYAGGSIQGYVLATHRLGQLGGGRAYTGISSGTVPFAAPPAGTWHVSLLVTEYDGGRFVIRDHGNFSSTLVIGSGGGGGTGGGGGSLSDVDLVGNLSYETQNNGTTVVIRADRVQNNEPGGSRSGTLRLELWATANAYTGGTLSGYRLAQHRLGELAGGTSYTNISSGSVPYTPPPAGTWRVTLILSEYLSSVSTNDGFSVRDWRAFSNPLVVGGGGGGTTTPPPTTPPPTVDDHGNTRANATGMALNSIQSGRINAGRDIDYFRVTTTVPGAFGISTSGNTDTHGQLEDANGSVIASDDDGDGINFLITTRTLPAGTYYVAVRHYSETGTGDYVLRVSFVPDTITPPPPTTTPPPPTTTPPPPTNPPPAASGSGRLVNLSVRSVAGAGERTLILGCVVGGSGSKSMLVRGIGPSLTAFQVGNALSDPQLQIYSGSTLRVSNDNWGQSPNVAAMAPTFSRLGAFMLPGGSRDAAVLDSFGPGAWSMQVSGPASGGVALVEVYDADLNPGAAAARLVNLSARTEIGTGERALFAGFAVSGGSRRVLIRGVGGSLRAFNLTGVLSDPVLQLFTGNTVIAENDDIASRTDRAQIEAAARSVGAFPLSSDLDAALLVSLPPGVYSAQVSGYEGETGVGLVEVYEVP